LRKDLEIFVDGACRGNPGPAAIGVIICEDGQAVKRISKEIGQATNNIAEYTALIYALQEALILKASHVKVNTDSELMYQQLTGRYKIRHDHLKPLFEQVRRLSSGFGSFEIKHIPREQNRDADKLATEALKDKQVKMVALASDAGEESPSSTG